MKEYGPLPPRLSVRPPSHVILHPHDCAFGPRLFPPGNICRSAGWFTFNDSRVTPTTEDAVKQAWGGRWSQTAVWQAKRSGGIPPPAVAPKWGNSAANAYMLMYRRVDPAINKRHLSRDEVHSCPARLCWGGEGLFSLLGKGVRIVW